MPVKKKKTKAKTKSRPKKKSKPRTRTSSVRDRQEMRINTTKQKLLTEKYIKFICHLTRRKTSRVTAANNQICLSKFGNPKFQIRNPKQT